MPMDIIDQGIDFNPLFSFQNIGQQQYEKHGLLKE